MEDQINNKDTDRLNKQEQPIWCKLKDRETNKDTDAEPMEVFPEKERSAIKEGLERLAAKLDSLEPKNLPKVILFADTGARPFPAAVEPVVRKVYENKGLPEPKLDYIQTFKHDLEELRELQQRRVDEVVKENQLTSDCSVLLVDDYLKDGYTYRGTKGFFEGKARMTYFAFISNNLTHNDPDILVGAVDPYTTDGGPATEGFTFARYTPDYVPLKPRVTGVEKNWNDTKVIESPKADPYLMLRFKEEMGKIGSKVAANI